MIGGLIYFSQDHGSITGELVNCWTEDYGEDYGDYPFATIVLKNFTNDGSIDDFDNRFVFANYYPELINLEKGKTYTFSYHKESRASDVTPITYYDVWILDNIN